MIGIEQWGLNLKSLIESSLLETYLVNSRPSEEPLELPKPFLWFSVGWLVGGLIGPVHVIRRRITMRSVGIGLGICDNVSLL
jgi:hypothetical protein